MILGTSDEFGDFRNPPAVDLKGSEIMCAIAVGDRGADPAALLIAESPQGALKPGPAF